jgi:Ca2+-binding EF-hand superfamily protein
MLFLGYVASSILLYYAIVQPDENERVRFVNECTRDLLINKATHDNWVKEKGRLVQMAHDEQLTDQQQAKQVFDQFDKNKNGTIDGEEIIQLLNGWEATENFMKRFSRWSKEKEMSFEFFYKNIWHLGQTAIGHIQEGHERSGKAKARFIFDHLDTDSSGYIDAIELQKLLIQWGLPDNEVDAYLASDDDKRFIFDEFYQNMKPIWDFAYENMVIKDVGQGVASSDRHSD